MEEYRDTRLIEPEEEEFFSTSDKILKLSDQLAEEIILENIEKQLDGKIDGVNDKLNYVSLFKEKYSNIDPSDDVYDKDYMIKSLSNVAILVATGLKNKYEVELGTDLDFQNPETYLTDIETLYEFLFIRQYENLIDYISYKIRKDRAQIVEKYEELIQSEEHSKDLFVVQSRKKFKNEDDIVILHFMNEIIDDICETTTSGYTLFETIVNLDLFEEYNQRMSELLINYGNKIVLNNDSKTAKLYLEPLMDVEEKDDLRSNIWSKYLEDCELIDD